MTKYILHGGYLRKATYEQNASFCREIIKDFELDRTIKILVCMFARPINQRQIKFEVIDEIFRQHLQNIIVEISDPERFLGQIREADVLFLEGGETSLLKEGFNKYKEWYKNFTGKVIVGTSAGAAFISKYYYKLHELKPAEGFRLLDIKVITHFDSDYNAPNIDWQKGLEELKSHKENLPVYAIKEGEYVVINK